MTHLTDIEGSSIAPSVVTLRRGALHISKDVYERYFSGLLTVILLRRNNDLLILPVRHVASGGYLLKIRNSDLDRTVDAVDFFRENGCDSPNERKIAVAWSRDAAALVGADTFPS